MVGLDRNGVMEIGYQDYSPKPTLRILSRDEWGAKPPLAPGTAMDPPLDNVRFIQTGTDTCSTHEECTAVLRNIQDSHMKDCRMEDIAYNFMIGGKGYVYEGRGWKLEPDVPAAYSDLKGRSIEVAYIGDFEDEIPPKEYLKAAVEFMVYVIPARKVTHFFKGNHLT